MDLYPTNRVKAINTFAIRILIYAFVILKRRKSDLTRFFSTIQNIHDKVLHNSSKLSSRKRYTANGRGSVLQISHYFTVKKHRIYYNTWRLKRKLDVICAADKNSTPLRLSHSAYIVESTSGRVQIINLESEKNIFFTNSLFHDLSLIHI